MNIIRDIQELKKRARSCPEILLNPAVAVEEDDAVIACYKLAINEDGTEFYNLDGVWKPVPGGSGGGGGIESIVAGTNITVDNTDPLNPIVSAGVVGIDTPIILTDGATVTWDMTLGSNAKVTIGGNRTLAITNAVAGDYGTLVIIQSGSTRTLALPAGSKVINGNAGILPLSTISGYIDIATFYYDGTTYFWNLGKNYS